MFTGQNQSLDTVGLCKENQKPKPRPNHSKECRAILKQWMPQHRANPYPTKAEIAGLLQQTRLSEGQLKTWMENNRKRLLKKNIDYTPKAGRGRSTRHGSKITNSAQSEKEDRARSAEDVVTPAAFLQLPNPHVVHTTPARTLKELVVARAMLDLHVPSLKEL